MMISGPVVADQQLADRWVRVGHSSAHDARTAGSQAVAQALAGRSPELVLVFCAASYDIDALLDGVSAGVPDDVPIVGGTTNGELAGAGPEPVAGGEPGVVVAAIGGAGFDVSTSVVSDASTDRHRAGAAAAAVLDSVDAVHRVVIMLADGLTREQHEIVRGAYSVLGLGVPIVGGCSGDDLDYAVTYQFHGTGAGVHCYVDSVVSVGLGSTAPIGVGIAHGWSKQGEPMMVTSSEGGEVQLLDGEPALDVYLRRIGESRDLLDDREKFREVAIKHPLGMSRRSGEDIRVVHDVEVEHGTLLCLADVPQGALAWTMSTDVDSLVDAARDSCAMALDGLDGVPPIGLLVFDCGARKLKLGEHLAVEQAAIEAAADGVPVAGFYTYGEIGRIRGSRGMHHLTVVTLALA